MNMRLTVEMIRDWWPCYDPVTMLDDKGKKAEIDFPGLSEDWTGPLSEILDMSEIPIADRVWVAAHALPPKEARRFACWCALRAWDAKAAAAAADANARDAAWHTALHAVLGRPRPWAERKAQLARLKKITKRLEAKSDE